MFIPQLKPLESALKEYGSPLFVTDAENIRKKADYLTKSFSRFNTKIFYAIKANFNPHLVRVIKKAGIYGIDTVSPHEVRLALDLGYRPDQIIFTPSNPSNAELKFVGKAGVLPNLGAVSEIERFGKLFPGSEVSIRICPEVGAGEFDKIITGPEMTKFGIMEEEIPVVKNICEKYNLKMVGIHSHIGSGFYTTHEFKVSVFSVCDIAKKFDHIRFIDFGGGFGVNYKIGESSIDISNFAEAIEPIIRDFEATNGREIEVRIEPGKFLVSSSTALLMTVTTIKQKSGATFVGCDAGFSNYIRPAMYGAFQDFINLSNPKGPTQRVSIAGNVCETCDLFNEGIDLPEVREGDVLAMVVAGAYGMSMSSNYNLREMLPEVMVDGGSVRCIRKRQSFEQMMENFDI